MTDIQALVLGFLQGATEYLPVSSTAHLRIVPALMGWKDPGAAFTAVTQWGTLLAALVYFRRDILRILFRPREATEEAAETDRHLLVPIILGTIPIVVCGIAFKDYIEGELRSLYVVGAALILFAVLLAIAEMRHRANRQMGEVTLADGLAVGFAQALALIPGVSRSGSTITAALFMGLERSTAARFSFLLSLPAVFAAGAYELYKKRDIIAHTGEARPLIIATIAAFVVGIASIDWLLKFLRRNPTYGFIAYRILLGISILSLAASGRIQ